MTEEDDDNDEDVADGDGNNDDEAVDVEQDDVEDVPVVPTDDRDRSGNRLSSLDAPKLLSSDTHVIPLCFLDVPRLLRSEDSAKVFPRLISPLELLLKRGGDAFRDNATSDASSGVLIESDESEKGFLTLATDEKTDDPMDDPPPPLALDLTPPFSLELLKELDPPDLL